MYKHSNIANDQVNTTETELESTQSIFRVQKNPDNPYVMVNKTALHDARLSWKAKGLLCYMLSMPDDWVFYRSELLTHATDGKDSLKSALKELQSFGYLTVKAERHKGKIISWITTVHEIPQILPEPTKINASARSGKTTSGKATCGKPATTNTECTNTDIINNHYDHNDVNKQNKDKAKKATVDASKPRLKERLSRLSHDEKFAYDKIMQLNGVFKAVAVSIAEKYPLGEINNVLEMAVRDGIKEPGKYLVKSLHRK